MGSAAEVRFVAEGSGVGQSDLGLGVVVLDGGVGVGIFERSAALSDAGYKAEVVRRVWGAGVGGLIQGTEELDFGFGGGVGALDKGRVVVSPNAELMRAGPD